MPDDERAYHCIRAAKERQLAAQAGDDSSEGMAHRLLADLCDEKATGRLPWLSVINGNSRQVRSDKDDRCSET